MVETLQGFLASLGPALLLTVGAGSPEMKGSRALSCEAVQQGRAARALSYFLAICEREEGAGVRL